MQALVAAKNRSVKGRVVVDKKRNKGKTSKKAMVFVTSNGVDSRTNDHFHIHHDKVIIVDGSTAETGSFNFAPSAETANSEKVVVIRDMPEVAKQYIAHWQSRWDLGKPYPPIDLLPPTHLYLKPAPAGFFIPNDLMPGGKKRKLEAMSRRSEHDEQCFSNRTDISLRTVAKQPSR